MQTGQAIESACSEIGDLAPKRSDLPLFLSSSAPPPLPSKEIARWSSFSTIRQPVDFSSIAWVVAIFATISVMVILGGSPSSTPVPSFDTAERLTFARDIPQKLDIPPGPKIASPTNEALPKLFLAPKQITREEVAGIILEDNVPPANVVDRPVDAFTFITNDGASKPNKSSRIASVQTAGRIRRVARQQLQIPAAANYAVAPVPSNTFPPPMGLTGKPPNSVQAPSIFGFKPTSSGPKAMGEIFQNSYQSPP